MRSSADDLDKSHKKCYINNNLGWVNQQEEAEVRNKRKRVGNQRDRGADITAEAGEVTRGYFYAFEAPVFSSRLTFYVMLFAPSERYSG